MDMIFELEDHSNDDDTMPGALTCCGQGHCFRRANNNEQYVRGNCVHLCALIPCTHPLCSKRLPKHLLAQHGGYCNPCHSVLKTAFCGNTVVFHSLHYNTDYCQLCYRYNQQTIHVCHS